MLTCQNISIKRGYNTLIEKLGFSLFRGACLNIYGANGIGKSSLLNHLATFGDLKDDTILLNNTDILKAKDEYKSLICYVGHKNAINLELTVRENLNFWARLLNRELTIAPAIECFNLGIFEDIKVAKLSQGWQRKVALARLMISDAIIWLLDEPFSNLDAESSEYLTNLIKIRCNQGGIVIFTSHTPFINSSVSNLNLNDFR